MLPIISVTLKHRNVQRFLFSTTMAGTSSKPKIAIFGTGGNISRGLIPLLINAGYDKVKVVCQKKDTILMENLVRGKDVILRGKFCLQKERVIDSMKGCSKVLLALPRNLKSSELLEYGKFIGDCAVEAKIPTLVRLAVSEYSVVRASTDGSEGAFQLLDSYLDRLNLEVVTIQSESMLSGRWDKKEMKQESLYPTISGKENVSFRREKTQRDRRSISTTGRADGFIGWSVTVDTNNSDSSESRAFESKASLWTTVSTSLRSLDPFDSSKSPQN
jgi:hypothetical protein